MIVTRLIGGLGNQLFQYAIARHLAEIHNTTLLIDVSEFETYKLHKYSLFAFNIRENIAEGKDIEALTYIKEKHYHFDPDFKNFSNDILLKGYWQSEKYFIDIAAIIREEVTWKNSVTGKDKELLEQISLYDSVSLHIRRGDYISNAYEDQILISSELDYYYRCVNYITQNIRHPHFFIFSDDPKWVKENLRLEYPVTYVDHNDAGKNYEDLRLMSQCKHNIICNSSFSWWGAWLNNNPNKIICAPKQWFSANARNINSKDLVPSSWVKV